MFKFHNFILKHTIPAIVGLVSVVIVLGFTASQITLEEDISNLIPAGERQDVLMRVLENTEFSDKIIVTISSVSGKPNPDELTVYAQRFIDSVNLHLPEYVNDIQGKVPEEGIREIYNFVYQNLPLFLNDEDYKTIEARLEQESIRERMRENYKNLISPTGLVTKEFLFKDPLSLTGIGLKKLEELQVGDEFELYNNFLITRDLAHVLLFISPTLPASETDKNQYFVNTLEQIQAGLNAEFPDIRGDFFGGVRYAIANANQIKSDIRVTLGIAGLLLLLLLVFYYRKIYVPLLIFLPSLLGGITAIAIIFLLKGSISAISLGIGAILLGISIDYSLHILTHCKNNNDIKKLYREVTTPVLMSSTTTAIAFLCLLLLNSEALNDLGIFAAISVVVSSVFALVLIPVLYKVPKVAAGEKTFIDVIASVEFHRKTPLVVMVFLLFLGGLFFFTEVEFNNDLSALNYQPEEIKEKEETVQEIAGKAAKSIYLVSYGNSVDEALEKNNSLYRELQAMENNGEINSYSSIGGVVLSTSTQLSKIEQWKEFWKPEVKQKAKEDLLEESGKLGFKPLSFQGFYELLNKDFKPLFLEDYRNTTTLYLDDFITSSNNFATVTTSINVEPQNMEALVRQFENNDKVILIDRQQINENFLGNLRNEFNKLIGFSVIAVFLVLLLFYRSLELTLLTLIPIGITWIITLGIFAVFDVEFNILNIIISTFIFGLGLDYSIFITNAFLREYETGIKVLDTYRTSILLSVLTTLLGIGALFFAVHPALRSISIVSVIGVITAITVAFVMQGFIFQALFINRKARGKGPFSFKSLLNHKKYTGDRDRLYHKRLVYDNYRYKKVFPEIKREFEQEKEHFLKVADFLNSSDRILHYPSGNGLLETYLHFKIPGIQIAGVEPNMAKLETARNTYSSVAPNLRFFEDLPEDQNFDVVILSDEPPQEIEIEIRKLITSKAKKVIILDPQYAYRWIIDINFEIEYRQNNVVLLQKVD